MLRAVAFVVGALLLSATLPTPPPGMAAGRGPRTASDRDPAPMIETVLLMGQSNMVGRDRPVENRSDARVQAFIGGAWRVAAEPLHGGGYGPGVSFGIRLVGDGSVRAVRLIPCAVGGTGMTRWVPTGDLYRACIDELCRSRQAATGVLFYQGESDAETPQAANAWNGRFLAMVDGLRRDTGNPGLPVVFAQLATTDRPTMLYWDVVKASQAAVSLPRVAMIRTEDLPVFDGLHLTVGAQQVIGCRFAREFARLRGFVVAGGDC